VAVVKRLLLLSCAALVFLSCYFPPYKEDLSLAVRTADKLEGRAVVGPIDRGPWDFRDREIWFYPSKDGIVTDSDYLRGFIVAVDDRSARLMYVGHSFISDDDYNVNFDQTVPLENSDETQFGYTIATIKDVASGFPPPGDMQELLGIALFDAESDGREYIMFDENYTFRGGSPLDMKFKIETDFGLGDALVLGTSFFPWDLPTTDRLHVFALDRTTGLFTEAAYDTNVGSALIIPMAIRTDVDLPGLPDDLSSCFFYHSPWTLRSYLSVYDPVRRGYRNFSWDGALQLQILTDMDRRIDLLLSNGWLFSRDGNTGYIYDSEGQYLNSFVMGGMQLVYEVFYGGEARVVFTVPAFAPVEVGDGGWNDRLFFLVYWTPTDQLADL
jgi:hypothetical protein